MRGALEVYSNLSDALAQPFACAQVERDSRPASGINIKPYGCISLCSGILADAGFLQVSDNFLRALPAC